MPLDPGAQLTEVLSNLKCPDLLVRIVNNSVLFVHDQRRRACMQCCCRHSSNLPFTYTFGGRMCEAGHAYAHQWPSSVLVDSD